MFESFIIEGILAQCRKISIYAEILTVYLLGSQKYVLHQISSHNMSWNVKNPQG